MLMADRCVVNQAMKTLFSDLRRQVFDASQLPQANTALNNDVMSEYFFHIMWML